MTTIIDFPQQRARGAALRNNIVSIQLLVVAGSNAVVDSILALLEQIQRTNASLLAYQAEIEANTN